MATTLKANPHSNSNSPLYRWLRILILGGGVIGILLMMAFYGGTAKPGPLFVLGVVVLAGLLVTFGIVVWWLYFSPLDSAVRIQPSASITVEQRQALVVLVVLSGLLFCTGAFWDEIWHRLYGVSFVISDFWWRPHILMYGSMGLIAAFAVGGLWLATRGTGDLRQRFRAAPFFGLLGLASTYLVCAAPSDELWHRIYGLDITAWSLPHIMFGVGTTLVMVAALALQRSLTPPNDWRGLQNFSLGDGLGVVLLMISTLFIMQVTITEWETFRAVTGQGVGEDAFVRAFWARPEWMYPVALIGIVGFVGTTLIHALRRAGVATLLALAVLAFRLGMLSFFELGDQAVVVSQILIIPPALALDLWYAFRLKQADTRATLIGGALALTFAFCAVSLPLLPQFLAYPRVTLETVPSIVLAGTVMALWSAWLGGTAGNWLNGVERSVRAETALSSRVMWIGIGGLVAYVAFALFFILTARPPIG